MDLASQGVRLLHLAGFGTGIALYAMLGMMVLQASRAPGSRKDRIPLSTAVLGVLCLLLVLTHAALVENRWANAFVGRGHEPDHEGVTR